MVRTDHLLQVRIIRFMQRHHTPSSVSEHSAFLLFACIVLWTDVITGIPLAVVAKLRARHLFPTSSLSKNKWNSFCYYLHVWFAFHSYSNKQNCSNICQWKESLNQQRERVQRQHAGLIPGICTGKWMQSSRSTTEFIICKYLSASLKLMRLLPFEILSMQFTKQIISWS